MNVKKLVVVGIIALALGWIIYEIIKPPKTVNISILLIEAPKDSVQKQNIIESIIERVGNKPVKTNITTFLIEKNSWSPVKTVNKPSGIEREDGWSKRLQKEISAAINQNTKQSIPEELVNAYLEAFAQRIVEQEKNGNALFVIAGAFPECYNATLAQEGVKKMQMRLGKNFSSANTQILWKVTDTREAEENVLKGLKVNFKENVDDKRVVIPRRVCLRENGNQVDVIAFSNLDSIQAREITSKITNNVSLPIALTLVTSNSSLKNTYSKKEQADSTIYATLISANQSEWKAAKFMFQQAFNKYASTPDSLKANVYLVGKMPNGKERLFDISKLKNRNNPHFFVFITPKEVERYILNSFKSQNVNISKLHIETHQITALK